MMLTDDNFESRTLIIADGSMAFTDTEFATTYYRLPCSISGPSAAVLYIAKVLDRKLLDVTCILVCLNDKRTARIYRRTAVALARQCGALLGEITPLGQTHIATITGRRSKLKALWLSEGIRALVKLEPITRACGVEPEMFVIVRQGEVLTRGQRKRNVERLASECKRLAGFWRDDENNMQLTDLLGAFE
jgi:hypothetical protein